jgi:hypothetical protein
MTAGSDSPPNDASRSVFEKLGLARDVGPEARPFADESRDLGMAIDRAMFEHVNAAALAQVPIARIA